MCVVFNCCELLCVVCGVLLFVGCCLWLRVVRCSLFVGGCSSFVVCCSVFVVVCCLLVGCWLFVVVS